MAINRNAGTWPQKNPKPFPNKDEVLIEEHVNLM